MKRKGKRQTKKQKRRYRRQPPRQQKPHFHQPADPDAETRHHRMPKSRGGTGDGANIVLVPLHLHRAYHALFSNRTPKEMVEVLNNWISPEYEFVCLPRRFKRQ